MGTERWSNLNNVFQFIRIEDTAYDRNNPRIMYLADTGEPRAKADATTGRLRRDATGGGPYMNGRLYKLELGSRPVDGREALDRARSELDALRYDDPTLRTSPTTSRRRSASDPTYHRRAPGSHNAQPALATATNARIWRYDLTTHALSVVAEVNQSVPGSPVTAKGSWESSGVVDASPCSAPARSWSTCRPTAGTCRPRPATTRPLSPDARPAAAAAPRRRRKRCSTGRQGQEDGHDADKTHPKTDNGVSVSRSISGEGEEQALAAVSPAARTYDLAAGDSAGSFHDYRFLPLSRPRMERPAPRPRAALPLAPADRLPVSLGKASRIRPAILSSVSSGFVAVGRLWHRTAPF